jgi:type I restriction enzyme S subunit
VSSHYFLFSVDSSVLDVRFLGYYIKTPSFRDQVLAQGSTNYAAIRPSHVLAYTMPLPPLEEQRRIVARIAGLSKRLASANEMRGLVESEANAVLPAFLNELFGNPYRSVVGTLAVGRYERIADVSDDVADGPHVTPRYVESGVPFVTVLNITSGRVNFSSLKHITQEDHQQFQRRARAEQGNVLISKDGSIGIPCFVDTAR